MQPRSYADIEKIIVHCSASDFGDAAVIDAWHRERGFDGIGYHFVILNGRRTADSAYDPAADGEIEKGRPVDRIGAHCRGANTDSVGVCVIGDRFFTSKQLLSALPQVLLALTDLPGITHATQIYGHRDFSDTKTCPNIDTQALRFMAGRSLRWT